MTAPATADPQPAITHRLDAAMPDNTILTYTDLTTDEAQHLAGGFARSGVATNVRNEPGGVL